MYTCNMCLRNEEKKIKVTFKKIYIIQSSCQLIVMYVHYAHPSQFLWIYFNTYVFK